MLRINDLEEKKLIVANYKCGSKIKKGYRLFTNSQIHEAWRSRWKEDFSIGDKCLTLYKQKFVVSAAKWKKGIKPKEYEEYTIFLSNIRDWINRNYNTKQSRHTNRKKFHRMLVQLREEHLNDLKDKISDSKYEVNKIPVKSELELSRYNLICDGQIVANGQYDEIIEYLELQDNS